MVNIIHFFLSSCEVNFSSVHFFCLKIKFNILFINVFHIHFPLNCIKVFVRVLNWHFV